VALVAVCCAACSDGDDDSPGNGDGGTGGTGGTSPGACVIAADLEGGDIDHPMTVDASQVVRDVRGATREFGAVAHWWLYPGFVDWYDQEIGFAGSSIRMGHKAAVVERGFPPQDVLDRLLESDAEIMISLFGVPADIAYCSGYQGTTCEGPQHYGPPTDLAAYKSYVQDVVTHYNALGIDYFIIWNEPNNTAHMWQRVCSAPDNCWQPTVEELIDVTVWAMEGIVEVDPANRVGILGTSSFFGTLPNAEGQDVYILEEVLPALEARGLKPYAHHSHYYNPDPFDRMPGEQVSQTIASLKSDSFFDGIGFHVDEFSDGITNMGDHRQAAFTLALLANDIDIGIDRWGYFQINSSVHDPQDGRSTFLSLNENMIDDAGVAKPVFWLSSLLHRAPGTNLLADEHDETGSVRAFAAADSQARNLCWYAVNFDQTGTSARVELSLEQLPQDVTSWRVTSYRIDADHGNPYHPTVEGEIAAILQPIVDEVTAQGGERHQYYDAAWSELEQIHQWPTVRPTEEQGSMAGGCDRVTAAVTIPDYGIRVLCLEEQ
jgi:hypothetical protein